MIRNNRRVAVLCAAGALTITPVLTGCGSGFSPQTTRPSQPPQGLNLQVPQDTAKTSQIEIRNLFALGTAAEQVPAGTDVPVFAELINSDQAHSAEALESVSSPNFSSSQIVGGTVPLPWQQLVSLNGGTQPLVILKGLTQPLFNGESIQVTLTFAQAGSVTVPIQVVPDRLTFTTYPAAPVAPTATPTATGTAGITMTPNPADGGTTANPAAIKKDKKKAKESATPTATP